MDKVYLYVDLFSLCTLEKKIYQEILNELYDEELAYIYCFRHQYIMKRIKTIDEKFAANRYTQENERVKERLRQLRESLKIRYQNLRRVAVRVEDKETEVSIEDSAIMFMSKFNDNRSQQILNNNHLM